MKCDVYFFTDSPNSSSGLSSFSASSSSSSTHQVSSTLISMPSSISVSGFIWKFFVKSLKTNICLIFLSRKWSKLNLCPRWPQNRILWRVVKKIPIKRIIVFLFSVELKLKFVFLIQNSFLQIGYISFLILYRDLYAWVLSPIIILRECEIY